MRVPLLGEDPEINFHENARDLTIQYTRRYGERLIRDAVGAARDREHPIVLKKDVQYSYHRLRSAGRSRRGVFLQFIGAGLLGVFVQGFTAEMLSGDPNPWTAVAYVAIGFLGIFSVFWSLIR